MPLSPSPMETDVPSGSARQKVNGRKMDKPGRVQSSCDEAGSPTDSAAKVVSRRAKRKNKLEIGFSWGSPNADLVCETEEEGTTMVSTDALLGTVDLSVGILKADGNGNPTLRIEPFHEWHGEIQAAVDEINHEMRSIVNGRRTQLRAAADGQNALLETIAEIMIERTRGRLHLLKLDARLKKLLRSVG